MWDAPVQTLVQNTDWVHLRCKSTMVVLLLTINSSWIQFLSISNMRWPQNGLLEQFQNFNKNLIVQIIYQSARFCFNYCCTDKDINYRITFIFQFRYLRTLYESETRNFQECNQNNPHNFLFNQNRSSISPYVNLPEITICFQNTALTWLSCGILWLIFPFYASYLNNKSDVFVERMRRRKRSWLNIFRLVGFNF